MSGGIIEDRMDFPAEHQKNVYGQFDEHIKKLERSLNVTLISRDAGHFGLSVRRATYAVREAVWSSFWSFPGAAARLRSRM